MTLIQLQNCVCVGVCVCVKPGIRMKNQEVSLQLVR